MRRYAAALLLILFCSWPVAGELAEIGVNPLRLEIAGRPLGLGAAFTGLADDVNSALYNPGGLAWVKGISLTFKDFDNMTALQAYPTGFGSSFGLAVISQTINGIPISGGSASSNSNVVILAYGTKLSFLPVLYQNPAWQRVGVGFAVKGLLGETLRRTGVPDRSATGWDIDLGILYKATDWWSIGLSGQNILPAKALGGGTIYWDQGIEEGVPATLKLGASAKVIGDLQSPVFMEGRELTLAGELDYNSGGSFLFRLGGEWGVDKTWFLRTGFLQQQKAGGTTAGLNFGAGYRNESWGADVTLARDPLREESQLYFSLLYFPKDWIVLKRLDVDKPSLYLESALEKISLEDNIVTYDDRIEVFGRVKPGVEVYVNNLRAATDSNNNFKVVVPLQYEKNLIVVEARYEGDKKSWKYKVLRKAAIKLAEESEVQRELQRAKDEAAREALRKKEAELAVRRNKIEELVTLGVIEVSAEAEFRLDASITRGELASWLAKSTGNRIPKVEQDVYPDVLKDNPLAPYIKAVSDWRLMAPFPDGYFRPNTPVSKEEGERLFQILKKAQR
ncbi:MAG: S-layer homology domain-containing protein [Candidatus Margulisbacteria bacterium]|jgi:hypothetical protein|nr:S-layer homology domain-containing protein [Candidatus Margulisiibacteriota bacterium]